MNFRLVAFVVIDAIGTSLAAFAAFDTVGTALATFLSHLKIVSLCWNIWKPSRRREGSSCTGKTYTAAAKTGKTTGPAR